MNGNQTNGIKINGRHCIGFSASREGNDVFAACDPATGAELEPSYAEATAAEIDRALALAQSAHASWKRLPRERRADLLEKIADEIEALGAPLLEAANRETALPLPRLTGERGRTVGQLRLFAAEVRDGSWLDARIDRAIPDRAPLPKPDVRSFQQALGPVVVFGASNFPLAFSVAGGDTASALAAGCPVVAKGHPAHPATSELVGGAIQRAVQALDLPEGTFSLLHGRSNDLGATLVRDPRVQAVGFTGSLRGGKALFDLAASRPDPIPVYAEMGSTNPVFVLPGALAQGNGNVAAGLAGSVTLGVGQFCTNPGLVVALAGETTQELASSLAAKLGEVPVGTMLHPGIRAAYDAGVERLRSTPGVQALTNGTAQGEVNKSSAAAALFQTDATTFRDHPGLSEEVFGPSTLLVTCSSKDEMLDLAKGLEGQLTSTLLANDDDLEAFEGLVDVLTEKAGRVIFNGYPTGVEVCPSMHHGGPFPATTAAATTSVGTRAIRRFTRPICFQGAPQQALPLELRDKTEGLLRMIDSEWSREAI